MYEPAISEMEIDFQVFTPAPTFYTLLKTIYQRLSILDDYKSNVRNDSCDIKKNLWVFHILSRRENVYWLIKTHHLN